MSRVVLVASEGDCLIVNDSLPVIYGVNGIKVLFDIVFDHCYTLLALKW